MAPLLRHTLRELQAFRHEDLVDLILDLESRNADLEAAAAAASGRRAAEGKPPQRVSATEPKSEAPAPKPRTLERAISAVPDNTSAAAQLRAELAQVLEGTILEQPASGDEGRELHRLTHSNFFLPDLRDREPEFAAHVRSKLVSPYHQEALEEERVLNWAVGQDLAEEHRLHVLWTQSDGNCLLHAALLAMWGLHDTRVAGSGGLSTLRAAMSRLFQEPSVAEPVRRRWSVQIARDSVWEPASQDKASADAGTPSCPGRVEISDAQLAREWAEMVELVGRQSAFLDSVHVLMLAHALRRPVVILASPTQRDPFGVPLTPIFFRGIYLPFERLPSQCCRQPLVLCFQDAHFMPLVPVAAPEGACAIRVPLADGNGQELPLRFALEEELKRKWELVRKYLDVEPDVQLPTAKLTCQMALLRRDSSHPSVKEMMAHFVERGEATFAAEREEASGAKRQAASEPGNDAVKRQKQAVDGQRSAERPPAQPAAARPVAARPAAANGGGAAGGAAGEGPPAVPSAANGGEEPDAEVMDRWEVRLAKGSRPGERSTVQLPKGCTEPDIVHFKVPRGRYEGDIVTITARFKVKGRCIKALREAAQMPRAKAVALLTKTHGDPNAAAREYFERQA